MQAKTPAAYALNIRRLGISLTQFAGFTLSEVCQSTNRPDVHANPPSITPDAHAIDTARWHQILGFEARLHCLLRGCFVKHARTKESGYQDCSPVNTTPGPSQTRNTKPHWHPVRRVRVLDEVRNYSFYFQDPGAVIVFNLSVTNLHKRKPNTRMMIACCSHSETSKLPAYIVRKSSR